MSDWLSAHVPHILASLFVLVLLGCIGAYLVWDWWVEQRDRAEMVEHLRKLDARAAEMRRQGRS